MDTKTNEIGLFAEFEISDDITEAEREIAFQLCNIIRTKLYVEYVEYDFFPEGFSLDTVINLIVFKDNGEPLSKHKVIFDQITGKPSISGANIKSAVKQLYALYVDENIDAKLDMMGL